MQNANTLLGIYKDRGVQKLPLERIYRELFNPDLYLSAYGKIYRNIGATTRGSTEETVDGMSTQKIHKIIGLLRMERYKWTPVRRVTIPKGDGSGKVRPLGIPVWSDKLVQEVMRTLLEAYYEPQFSTHSYGFRPQRGCHSALREIHGQWTGTVWFIEGDIKGCFDNIDHSILLEIIQRNIHDGRLTKLIGGLLEAGFMENWQRYDTLSGTPQGGIISPLLANIYLNELDRFAEGTLIPAYTKGIRRGHNKEYAQLRNRAKRAEARGNLLEAEHWRMQMRTLPSLDAYDPNYRRLRYIRYADDFLLGFVGPKSEAVEIRDQIEKFLATNLKLTLSPEKTLITHAVDGKAKFLGHEITVTRNNNLLTEGKRSTNGHITLMMPQKVVQKYRKLYSKKGKINHRAELTCDEDYTIVQRYQSVLKGVYNFYCMAVNVAYRMSRVKWILRTSMLKTLANKHRCGISEIIRKFRHVDIFNDNKPVLRVVVPRPDRDPLVATFGGFPFKRIPGGMGIVDFDSKDAWFGPGGNRSEVVVRLMAGKCELCGIEGVPLETHHIRKLADIDRPGRRPKTDWEKLMSARKRKTLIVCFSCHHHGIHGGRYDGSPLGS